MIYPKKSGAGAHSENNSRRLLNPEQKDELKKAIAERLSKKYGLKYQDLINDEVSNFMNQQKNITAVALQELENNIKNATQPKNVGRDFDRDDDEKSVKSGISKMSGASNFDQVDKYTKKNVSKEVEEDKKNDKKLQTLNVRKPENDLDFLEEENEWAAIYKYNRYLYEKEEELKKQKQREQKIKMKDELDRQIQEREEKKLKEKKEAEKFAQNQQIQIQRYDDRERQKNLSVQQLRLAEKEAREKQIKENKVRRKHEVKEEKALDNFLMTKVKEELEAEAKYIEYKKEHQKEVMEKLLIENEERRKVLKLEEERERQENISLMNAYAKLIQDQEDERERTLQERDRKMKEFQAKALEVVKQDNEDKIGWMEKRREKYEARHEKKLQQEEEQKKLNLKQQKSDIKGYLMQQMEEKGQRRVQDKYEYNQQAEIWKKDNEKFSEFEAKKQQQKTQIMKQYFGTLQAQLKDNEQSKKISQAKMSENEALLNKHLLEELEGLKRK